MMIVAKRILELRKEMGKTQRQVAEAVGVNRSAVSFWEREITEPTATYIVRLAKFFGVSADYLLGMSDEYAKYGQDLKK